MIFKKLTENFEQIGSNQIVRYFEEILGKIWKLLCESFFVVFKF